jgi:hypothetical protein
MDRRISVTAGDTCLAIRGDDAASLHALGTQCRRLARGASTSEVAASLNEIAANYEELAARAEAAEAETTYADGPDFAG